MSIPKPRSRLRKRWTGCAQAKAAPSPFAGIPVSIKDLFDIKGQVTRAGSRALEDSAAGGRRRARGGAVAPRRLRRDRPHQHDRIRLFRHRHQSAFRHAEGRMAAQRRAMCPADRRRAPRCPSPTAWRMARSAPTPAARAGFRRPTTASSASSRRSAGCRWMAACRCRSRWTVSDRLRARSRAAPCSMPCSPTSRSLPLQPRPIKGMRLAVPTTVALDELDDAVARAFERALEMLVAPGRADRADRGAGIPRRCADECQGRFCRGGKLCLASLSHRQQGRYLRSRASPIRILRGESFSAADYIDLLKARENR